MRGTDRYACAKVPHPDASADAMFAADALLVGMGRAAPVERAPDRGVLSQEAGRHARGADLLEQGVPQRVVSS